MQSGEIEKKQIANSSSFCMQVETSAIMLHMQIRNRPVLLNFDRLLLIKFIAQAYSIIAAEQYMYTNYNALPFSLDSPLHVTLGVNSCPNQA